MATYNRHPHPFVALLAGLGGLLGTAGAVIADVIGSFVVNDYNPVQETISDLAAGQSSWILDTGLQVLAAGVAACAIGLYVWRLGENKWDLGILLLLLVAFDLIVIARHNAYGDNIPGNEPIHIYLVVFFGIAFGLSTWLLTDGFKRINDRWRYFGYGVTAAWFVAAPLFFLISTSWDGLFERFVALIMVVWIGRVSWLLVQEWRRSRAEG